MNYYLDKSNEKIYIMMEARLSALFKTAEEYEILERFKGETLKGKTYLPLFPYFAHVIITFTIFNMNFSQECSRLSS